MGAHAVEYMVSERPWAGSLYGSCHLRGGVLVAASRLCYSGCRLQNQAQGPCTGSLHHLEVHCRLLTLHKAYPAEVSAQVSL